MADATDGDRRAIEALHRRDVRASRSGDFATLRSLMDDEAVVLPPGGRRQVGREELDAAFAAGSRKQGKNQVLEYEQEFEEVKILGDYAFEWGMVRGTMRASANEPAKRSAFHLMRILRKQPDGSWKVYRTIWTPAPVAPVKP